jgi:hypothetical protein
MLGFLKRYGLTFAILAIVGVLGVSVLAEAAKAGGGGFAQANVQKVVQVQHVQQFAVPVYQVQQVQHVQQFAVVPVQKVVQFQAVQKANVGCATQSLGSSRARQVQRSGPLFSRSRTTIR